MRVGLYNRWLATLGGGEKHSLAIAEYLSARHQVQVVTHKPVPKELAEERLGFDLSNVEFIAIPDRYSSEVAAITSDYDLFINASYMDFMPSFARYSAALIYFPARVDRRKSLARRLKLSMRRWLKLPAVLTGIHAFKVEAGEFKWATDTVLKIRLPYTRSPYRFSFRLSALDERVQSALILLDKVQVGRIRFPLPCQPVPYEVVVPARQDRRHGELTICVDGDVPVDGLTKMEISSLWLSLPEYRVYKRLFERGLVGIGIRLQYYPPGASMLDYIDTYGQIWANSEFTRRWIRHYWKRDSQVLYPPVNVEDFWVGEKRNQIINVGRFFAGQHNKKHLVMIEAFRQMVDAGLHGWELHLAGAKMPGEEHAAYLEQVYQACRGYPITIHTDISFQELARLYAQSAIYWHASGYGEDERAFPDKFEHFGITTVEGMAAGCVPVVIGKGGQPEIVRHGVHGFLWQSLEDLKSHTLRLVHDPTLRQQMAAAALVESKKYDKQHFRARLDQLLGQIGFPV